jgi:hypothetical protein
MTVVAKIVPFTRGRDITLSARPRGERVRAQRAGEVGLSDVGDLCHLTLPIAYATGPFPLPHFVAEREMPSHVYQVTDTREGAIARC